MKVYITFGQVHTHSINGKTLDKDTVAVIECESYSDGRSIAFSFFGPIFHNCVETIDDEFMSFFPKGLVEVN